MRSQEVKLQIKDMELPLEIAAGFELNFGQKGLYVQLKSLIQLGWLPEKFTIEQTIEVTKAAPNVVRLLLSGLVSANLIIHEAKTYYIPETPPENISSPFLSILLEAGAKGYPDILKLLPEGVATRSYTRLISELSSDISNNNNNISNNPYMGLEGEPFIKPKKQSVGALAQRKSEVTSELTAKIIALSKLATKRAGGNEAALVEMNSGAWKGRTGGMIKNWLLKDCKTVAEVESAGEMWKEEIDAYFTDPFWSGVAFEIPQLTKFARGRATRNKTGTPLVKKQSQIRYRVVRRISLSTLTQPMIEDFKNRGVFATHSLNWVVEEELTEADVQQLQQLGSLTGETGYDHEVKA